MGIKDDLNQYRAQIRDTATYVKGLHDHDFFDKEKVAAPEDAQADVNEMHANIALAYRHLEDARMRLGKAIQAYDGGKSCYD